MSHVTRHTSHVTRHALHHLSNNPVERIMRRRLRSARVVVNEERKHLIFVMSRDVEVKFCLNIHRVDRRGKG